MLVDKNKEEKSDWEKLSQFINEEMNKPHEEPIIHLSPYQMKVFEDTLKEIYPNIKFKEKN